MRALEAIMNNFCHGSLWNNWQYLLKAGPKCHQDSIKWQVIWVKVLKEAIHYLCTETMLHEHFIPYDEPCLLEHQSKLWIHSMSFHWSPQVCRTCSVMNSVPFPHFHFYPLFFSNFFHFILHDWWLTPVFLLQLLCILLTCCWLRQFMCRMTQSWHHALHCTCLALFGFSWKYIRTSCIAIYPRTVLVNIQYSCLFFSWTCLFVSQHIVSDIRTVLPLLSSPYSHHSYSSVGKGHPFTSILTLSTPATETSTGTTFGEQGQPMDFSHAKLWGLCFTCHQKGHISCKCSQKCKVMICQMLGEMSEAEHIETLQV